MTPVAALESWSAVLRCPVCSEEVNGFMGRCPGCAADLAAYPPVTAAPVRRLPRRAVVGAAGVVAALLVFAGYRLDGHHASPGRPPAASHSIRDPLAVPSQPTRSILVGVRQNRLVVVRVDEGVAGTVDVPVEAGMPTNISSVVGHHDSVVVVQSAPRTDGPVWAFSAQALAGRARPVRLGTGVVAFPDGESRVWVVSVRDGGYWAQSVELDGTARTAPVAVPGVVPIASVPDGLLVESAGPRLRIWSPVSRAFVSEVGAGAAPVELAAAGDLVAWRETSCFCAAHLFDVATGRDTSVTIPAQFVGADGYQAAMSSDGARLGIGLQRHDRAGFVLGVVNTRTVGLAALALPGPPAALVWSPDGRWLFESDGSRLNVVTADGGRAQRLGTFFPWAVIAEAAPA